MRTRVKICGFTRVHDAVYAAHLGVDAIGLVFYSPSARNIEINQAREIVRALPAFTSVVALFVDENQQRIKEVLQHVAIDMIQFHGDESPEFCRHFGKPYMKALRMQENIDLSLYSKKYYDAAGLLLDAYHPDAKGGTGKQFDWKLISDHCSLPLILAGGLTPLNAQRAVRTVRPYALDVSSGVETGKGIKDADKMSDFVNEVNAGDRNK